MYIANCPFNKMKILSQATIGLEKSFQMMYSNIGLNSRESVPLSIYFFPNITYRHSVINQRWARPLVFFPFRYLLFPFSKDANQLTASLLEHILEYSRSGRVRGRRGGGGRGRTSTDPWLASTSGSFYTPFLYQTSEKTTFYMYNKPAKYS